MAKSGPIRVMFGNDVVGIIDASAPEEPSFSYDRKWIADPNSFPISTTMPIVHGAYPSSVISPWLANLLPEEMQMKRMTKHMQVNSADFLSILVCIGGDTAGALSFGDSSRRERWKHVPLTLFYGIDDERTALERHFDDVGRRPFMTGSDGIRMSLAGGQCKTALSVIDEDGTPVLRLPGDGDILAVPMNGAPSTIIVKPDNRLFPGVVENETFCLRLSRRVGIDSADSTILNMGERTAICVLRYDRQVVNDCSIGRLHQEDINQANGMYPEMKYEHGGRGVTMKALLDVGRRLDSSGPESLFDHLAFRIMIADNDSHAKNYSLLLSGGSPRPAPAYDTISSLAWDHSVKTFPQCIAGRKRRPEWIEGRHWDRIASDSGLEPKCVRSRVREIADGIIRNSKEVAEDVSGLPGVDRSRLEGLAGRVSRHAGIISRQIDVRRYRGRDER